MKTHDFAEALKLFANILKKSPNMDLSELGIFDTSFTKISNKNSTQKNDLPIALNALISIKDFSKQDWINFIEEFQMEIEISARDSSRNILGKVLHYLENNPELRQKIKKKSENKDVIASESLLKAFSSLLKTD